jgi:hypothetical protein
MRTPSRYRAVQTGVLISVLLLAAGTLTGCADASTPTQTTRPAASTPEASQHPPIFASNDDALAAAQAAYTKYLTAGDTAGAIGTESWNTYLSLTTGSELEGVIAARDDLVKRDLSLTGSTSFDSMSIQSSGANANARWEIRTYVCLDLSGSTMVNAAEQTVSTPNRQVRWPMTVVFVTAEDNTQQLLVSESRVWSGSNFCSL